MVFCIVYKVASNQIIINFSKEFLGMFESNAIQFSMDQMLEASSE